MIPETTSDAGKGDDRLDVVDMQHSNSCGSGLPSYFLQKQLNVNVTIANDFFQVVAKGDISAVTKMERRIGLDVQYQVDAESGQNATFYAVLCEDETKAITMVKWLASKGCRIPMIDAIG